MIILWVNIRVRSPPFWNPVFRTTWLWFSSRPRFRSRARNPVGPRPDKLTPAKFESWNKTNCSKNWNSDGIIIRETGPCPECIFRSLLQFLVFFFAIGGDSVQGGCRSACRITCWSAICCGDDCVGRGVSAGGRGPGREGEQGPTTGHSCTEGYCMYTYNGHCTSKVSVKITDHTSSQLKLIPNPATYVIKNSHSLI